MSQLPGKQDTKKNLELKTEQNKEQTRKIYTTLYTHTHLLGFFEEWVGGSTYSCI